MRIIHGNPLTALPLAVALAGGCASRPEPVRATLARVGLELVSEAAAAIPPGDRGRYLPCRPRRGFEPPALPDDPAGYLIVGVNRRPAPDAASIRRALEAWRPGETLVLTVRRNPYRQAATGWWEAEVELRHPDG